MISFTYTGEDGEDIPEKVEQLLTGPSVEMLPEELCQGQTQLQHVQFSEGLKTIGNHAFASCSSVLNIKTPSSLVTIGNGSFLSCNSLVELELSDGLISIGEDAFSLCSSLARVEVATTVTTIEAGAFQHCGCLVEVVLYEGLTKIGKGAFASCSSLSKILLPSTVNSMGSRAFADCKALTEIVLRDALNEIAESLFCNCSSLKRVKLGTTTKAILQNAFYQCYALIEIDLPEGLEYIGNDAFSSCTSLQRVKIASTTALQHVGIRAFCDCYSLIEMLLPEGLSKTGADVFRSCSSLKRVSIPSTMDVIGSSALWKCTSLVEVELFEGLRVIAPFAFCGCTSLRMIGIPASVEHIGDYAFSDCANLIEVSLQDEGLLKTIGTGAFSGADSLFAITIPSTVEKISIGAFLKCTHLVTVELADQMEATITESSFARCYSLTNIEWPRNCSVSEFSLDDSTPLWRKQYSTSANAVDAISSRFQDYPVHRLCYNASTTSVDSLYHQVRSSRLNKHDNSYGILASLSKFVHHRFGFGNYTTPTPTCTFPPTARSSLASDQSQDYYYCNYQHLVDPFGMTPFHVLGSAAQSRPDLWQILLDSFCYFYLMLDHVDESGRRLVIMLDDTVECSGRRPLEYLVLCGSWTVERRLMMQMALEKWMMDRIANWGKKEWKSPMEAKIRLVLEYENNEHEGRHTTITTTKRLSRMADAYQTLKRYEVLAGMSILELALWKNTISSSSSSLSMVHRNDDAGSNEATDNDTVDRSACRSRCGASFAVPLVLSFLVKSQQQHYH